MTTPRLRITAPAVRHASSRRFIRRLARQRLGRGVVVGILGLAVLLGLGLAIPTPPSETAADLLGQSVWPAPVPSFLSPAPDIRAPSVSSRGLVPTDPPRVLGAPIVATGDSKAAAGSGGIPVRVYFSRRPRSESAFSEVFPVARVARDRAVATAALASLIEGPNAAERASGYFSELGGALAGSSSCSGHDFRIAIADGTATVRFCRRLVSAGVGQDARIRSQIEATLRQFSTIKAVTLLDDHGRCLFEQSGQDRCLMGQAATGPKSEPRAGGR